MPLIKRTPADVAFSLCVRERANWQCERCGSTPHKMGLHCAHIMSRGNLSTRHDPSNALALCYGCHQITGQRVNDELYPLAKKVFGELEFDRVCADAKRPAHKLKRQLPLIAKHYRDQHAAMVKLRDAGSTGRLNFVGWMR